MTDPFIVLAKRVIQDIDRRIVEDRKARAEMIANMQAICPHEEIVINNPKSFFDDYKPPLAVCTTCGFLEQEHPYPVLGSLRVSHASLVKHEPFWKLVIS